ncbi:MAG: succinate dehydrogenase, hydrophobic membrane anchor protein [Rhodospirillaceae bacterium]|jgi:succinate dehydrogenase / fumarate reductase, membrane anchor subunit|nr:succinate dehydrogenase, hydrophobic membrane anchor protein [Rhodospirillaceae bacterium]MBT7954911.1 succinate dehydrogenase, hydrophobic membrane anchor protein [Rhodospirillaceae bacterium]
MSLRSDLGRVRGLGSANEGTSHWWAQRVTAIALIPLSLWFIYSAVTLVGIDRAGFKVWLNAPGSILLMTLFVIALFYHMQLGLQVVIEDYVHNERNKIVSLVLNKLVAIFFAVSSIIALIKVAFGG